MFFFRMNCNNFCYQAFDVVYGSTINIMCISFRENKHFFNDVLAEETNRCDPGEISRC